jgi:hypothetical protein
MLTAIALYRSLGLPRKSIVTTISQPPTAVPPI